MIAAQLSAKGYPRVRVTRGGRTVVKTVHGLVLAAFVGPRPAGSETRHLDGNKLNNRLDNLAWGTRAENEDDHRRHGTKAVGDRHWSRTQPELRPRGLRQGMHTKPEARRPGSSNGYAKLVEGDARVIHMLAVERVDTQVNIGRAFGVSQTPVRNIALGKGWRHVLWPG